MIVNKLVVTNSPLHQGSLVLEHQDPVGDQLVPQLWVKSLQGKKTHVHYVGLYVLWDFYTGHFRRSACSSFQGPIKINFIFLRTRMRVYQCLFADLNSSMSLITVMIFLHFRFFHLHSCWFQCPFKRLPHLLVVCPLQVISLLTLGSLICIYLDIY